MTIKDLAKVCGVSVSTVSRVLNNRPDVSAQVRSRVLEAVEAQGYIPNNSARDLVRSSSDDIGVVVRGTDNPFFSEILKIISQEIDRSGHHMVLHFIDSRADEVKAGAMLEREKKLIGLILLGGRFDYTPAEVSLIGIPYVCCSYTNCFGSLCDDVYSSVSIDDYETAYKAVSYLIEQGHRRIAALVPSFSDHSISELRFKGYTDALRDAGIASDASLYAETGGFDLPKFYQATHKLCSQGTEFSAVFTISDTSALAVIRALADHGKRVPEDCSVIAIDGLEMSNYYTPALTTMVQPAREMGKKSVEILISMLNGDSSCHVRAAAMIRPGQSVRHI